MISDQTKISCKNAYICNVFKKVTGVTCVRKQTLLPSRITTTHLPNAIEI